MADYFCTHCGCRHEPLAHVRHVTAREKLDALADRLADDALAADSGTAETVQLAQCEASQSGPKGNAQ